MTNGLRRAGPWLAGVGLAVLLLGPLLGPGNLVNLDLVLIDPIPVPSGVWGLGPELPRRVPFMLPVAWTGALFGAWTATRGLLILVVATATAGMHRAARGLPPVVRYGLAIAYGAGPFMVTRLGIGHLAVALAAALTPWVLPTLLRPTRSPAHTVLAAAALGLAGITGGIYAGLAIAAGLIADRPAGRDTGRLLGAVAVTQLPWAIPGTIVFAQGVDPSNSVLFGARLRSPLDLFRLAAGHGFWQDRFQIGFGRLDALLVGAVLVGLAAVGARRLPDPWRGRGAGLAAVVILLVVAGAVPGVDAAVASAVGNPVLAPLREAHRLLPLALVWLLLAAGHGAMVVAGRTREAWRPAVLVVPLAAGLVVAGPGAWGLGDDLRPFPLHPDWKEARALIEGHGGSVIALPWAQYLSVDEFDGRRVHHPAPFTLAADVVVSSDPRLGGEARERADEREPIVDGLVERIRSGESVGDELADLGARWVLILHAVDWEDYTGLVGDPRLERRVAGDVLDLYEIRGPVGPVITATRSTSPRWLVKAMGRVDAPEGGTWLSSGEDGWLRGLSVIGGDGPGRLTLPAGDGVVWYWPALLVALADAAALTVIGIALVKVRRSSPTVPG